MNKAVVSLTLIFFAVYQQSTFGVPLPDDNNVNLENQLEEANQRDFFIEEIKKALSLRGEDPQPYDPEMLMDKKDSPYVEPTASNDLNGNVDPDTSIPEKGEKCCVICWRCRGRRAALEALERKK